MVQVGAREPGLFTGSTMSNQHRIHTRRAGGMGHTFFSSSSSSFHLAPRSLPISPVRRVPSAPVAVATNADDCKLTETGVGVLSFDPLAPVLAEEHVRGQGTLGCLGVLLPLGLRRLLRLFSGLALNREPVSTAEHRHGPPRARGWGEGGRVGEGGEHIRTLVCLVVSLGICNVTNVVSDSSNTSRNKEEAFRPGAHGRDACSAGRV